MHRDDVEAIATIGAVPTILRVVTAITGMRLSLVARVTPDHWRCCAVNDQLGFGMHVGDHLDVATTLCAEVRDARAPIVISHVASDARYAGHPTPARYGFQSYIAVPILLRDGGYFGNVCALDSAPAQLDDKALSTLQLFAELIALELEVQEAAARREQFIAVLAHDLRSPLGTIMMGAETLRGRAHDDADARVADRVLRGARRIGALVDDLLDSARGRLGGGLPLDTRVIEDIEGLVRGVVEEVRGHHPARSIALRVDRAGALRGDPGRLSQLVANLLANAIQHGAEDAEIEIAVTGSDGELAIAVRNQGAPIDDAARARLFEPFQHDGRRSSGLGLGLYIVSEIARSHGGTIDVQSDAAATTFTCRLPR